MLDNAPSHPSAEELNIIDSRCFVVDLPPNVTSILQPMDQGPISAFKRHYKTGFLRESLGKNLQSRSQVLEFVKKRSLLECFYILKEAWKCLSDSTLSNAWKKLLLHCQLVPRSSDDIVVETQLVQLVSKIPRGHVCGLNDAQQRLQEEENLQTCRILSDNELLNLYAGCNLPVSVEEEDSDEDFDTFESIESEEEL